MVSYRRGCAAPCRSQVGTAINIARACNILPGNADVLELTTEKFPVLADVATSDLLNVQRQLDQARSMQLGARALAGGGEASDREAGILALEGELGVAHQSRGVQESTNGKGGSGALLPSAHERGGVSAPVPDLPKDTYG